MNRGFLTPLAQASRRSSGGVPTLAEVYRDDYNAGEIWPLVDIASGTNIDAFISSDRDGTLVGWDLKNAAGPVTGTLAPYSDGVNDDGDIKTASHLSIFNGSIGSVLGWFNVSNWEDGVLRYMLTLYVDSANSIQIYKGSVNNQIVFRYEAGNVAKAFTKTASPAGWFSVGVSWKDGVNGDAAVYYLDGLPLVTRTGFNNWVGSPNHMDIGGLNGNGIFDGWESYISVKYGSVWSDADFLGMHNAASTAGPD